MNCDEAVALQERVKEFLSGLWDKYPTINGHGARIGEDGKPEVFVAFTERVELPAEVNGVRIVSEVRPRAYLAGSKRSDDGGHTERGSSGVGG